MKSAFILFVVLVIALNSFSQVQPFKITFYDSTSTGYYFLSTVKPGNLIMSRSQIILDKKGEVIYFNSFPGSDITNDFKLQPNGLISFFYKGWFFLLDSTFNLVDTVSCQNGYLTDNHELQILSNGHYLLLGSEKITMDLSSYPFFTGGAYGSPLAKVKCAIIQELDSAKNVVFEWHAKDHFSFDDVDTFFLSDPVNVDWTHSNALESDYDGNILLSSRHFNEITKINRSDSSIMWRFGGKKNQFTFLSDSVRFWGQHDIRRISNGHVTLYDNGNHFIPHGARALEYELDELNKTADLKWSYVYDSAMFSLATGNVQRLPNSNTLVNFGLINQNSVCFSVVDPLGSKVFEIAFDDTLSSYRAFNYADLPWKLNRPVISCFDSLGVTYLDAGTVLSNTYLWNNGSTTQIIPITKPDTFFVWVQYGLGVLTSEKLIVTDLSNPCRINLTNESKNSWDYDLKIFPNPAGRKMNISYILRKNLHVNFCMSDMQGKKLAEWSNNNESIGDHLISYDFSELSPGIYFLKLNEKAIKFIKAE